MAPAELSADELETLTKRFAQKMIPLWGERCDVPAPDVNTNPQVVAWIFEEFSKVQGHCPGVVTGKPLSLGGSPGRLEATGYGVAHVTLRTLEDLGIVIRGARVVLQGFGNVGSYAAARLEELGARVIGLSDVYGAVHAADGIDVARAREHAGREGRLLGLAGTQPLSQSDLLSLDCDVLIPTALKGAVGCGLAPKCAAPCSSKPPTCRSPMAQTSNCASAAFSSYPTSLPMLGE